jgi:hypothetical protein
MKASYRQLTGIVGFVLAFSGAYAQKDEPFEEPLSRAAWDSLAAQRRIRRWAWYGPLRNKDVWGICFTPSGYEMSYNAIVRGLYVELLGIGTGVNAFMPVASPIFDPESRYEAYQKRMTSKCMAWQ